MTTTNGDDGTTKWSRIRFVVGMAQMAWAVIAMVLLVERGVTPLSLGAVLVTSTLTSVSVMFFGHRRDRIRSDN